MIKEISLCADDFGQEPHLSQAILDLVKAGRLSAVSCMTTCADWKTHGPKLKVLQDQVDVGLHFNLTHGEAKGYHSINYWLLTSLIRYIDKAAVAQKMNEQLDLFVSVMGRLPDFIDGHQHVHTFPVIRDVFIAVIQNRFQDNLPYVRSISPMLHTANSGPKALVVQGISSGFAQALDRYRIQHNTAFGGMYNLTVEKPYRQFMKRWLQEAPSGTMIMCHPGKESAQTTTDPHPEARVQEYTYFSSDVFQEDCALAGVILKRLSHL